MAYTHTIAKEGFELHLKRKEEMQCEQGGKVPQLLRV